MGSETQGNGQRVRAAAIAAFAIILGLVVLAVLFFRQSLAHPDGVQARASLHLTSTSFPANGAIPVRYTCNGPGISPDLKWSGAPTGTESFALIMHDPDASIDFTHWLAYNIPADVDALAQGAATSNAMPRGSVEGENSFHRIGYGPPCPPPGKPHHYTILFYALNTTLNLPTGASRQQLESAMRGHILAKGKLIGIYQHGE